MSNTPAGWYPQPDGQQRYWDGQQWTQHTRPVTPGGTAQQGPGNESRVLSIIAFVFSGLAVFIPLLGLIGVGFGVAALVRKEKLGRIALIVAGSVTVLSWIIWSMVYSG